MRILVCLIALSSLQVLAQGDLAKVLNDQNRAFVTVYLDHEVWPKDSQDQVAYTQMLQDAALEEELSFGFEVVRRYQSVPRSRRMDSKRHLSGLAGEKENGTILN